MDGDDDEQVDFSSIYVLLRTKQFLCIFVMDFLTIFFGAFIIGSYKSYGLEYIRDEMFLSKIGPIASLCGVFRFIWSFLIDHYAYKTVYGVLITIQIILAFTFPLIVHYKYWFAVWVCITMCCEGGHFTLSPAIYKKLFGSEGIRIFGWGYSFIGIASMILIATEQLFLDVVGFNGFIITFGFFNVIAVYILITVFEEEKVDVQKLMKEYREQQK